MKDALAKRVETLAAAPVATEVSPVPIQILDGVRDALLGGETHYTSRPGIVELRATVARTLDLPDRSADEVVITSGTQEAVFVTRLALGRDPFEEEPLPEDVIIGDFDGRPELASFRVGYVCAPKELAKKVRSWKQALSICTAAPSQRAAILALSS